MTNKHIHPVSPTTICIDGKERAMTEEERCLYNIGYAAYYAMHSFKRAFYIMVVANLVLIWLLWLR